MSKEFKINDKVTFSCHILGTPKGHITRFAPSILNGQMHAEIELLPPFPPRSLVMHPVEHLEPIA